MRQLPGALITKDSSKPSLAWGSLSRSRGAGRPAVPRMSPHAANDECADRELTMDSVIAA